MQTTNSISKVKNDKVECYWNGRLVDRYDARYMKSERGRKWFYYLTMFLGVVGHIASFMEFAYVAWFVFNWETVMNNGDYFHFVRMFIILAVMFGSLYAFETCKSLIAWMVRRHRAKTNYSPKVKVEYKNVAEPAKGTVA